MAVAGEWRAACAMVRRQPGWHAGARAQDGAAALWLLPRSSDRCVFDVSDRIGTGVVAIHVAERGPWCGDGLSDPFHQCVSRDVRVWRVQFQLRQDWTD